MANLTLTFTYPLNISIAVGDTAYYSSTSTSGDFVVNSLAPVEIGEIISVDHASKTIIVDTQLSTGIITVDDFIFFSKDNAASMSSILGYYAEVKMTNTDQSVPSSVSKQVELFQVGMDAFESSK